MKAKIIDFAQELSARGQQVADMANERTRGAVTQAATLLTDSKGPIKIAANFANGLNDVNHRYIRQVVELNAKAIQGSVDGGITRLKAVGSAKDLLDHLPNNRLHVVKGGGHLFLLHLRDQVAPIIRDFLDQKLPIPNPV